MTASFQSLVASLAACGGELLRQLAVEHEREVKQLHCEIELLQAHIAQSTGEDSPEFRLKIRAEAEKRAKKAINPVTNAPVTAKAQQQVRREGGRKSRSGKPDESALAKAFAFVDTFGDSINDDRGFLSAVPENHDTQDTSRVLEAASDIVDYVRQSYDSSRGSELDSKVPSSRSPSDDVRDEHAARPTRGHPQTVNVAPSLPKLEGAGSAYLDYRAGMVQPESSGQIGIKLSSISPPVKAPDRIPEPPYMPDDDDPVGMALQSDSSNEVLNERFKATYGPAAAASAASAAAAAWPAVGSKEPLGQAPGSSRWSRDDPLIGPDGTLSSGFAMTAEDVPLTTPRQPGSDEDEDADFQPVPAVPFFNAVAKPDASLERGGSSPMPSRETTTWQAPLEDAERQRIYELQREADIQVLPTEESESVSRRAEVPTEDWRALLQVHGSKWRPSGDDGVGIAMYLEAPAAAAPSDGKESSGVVTPTSI